MRKTFVAATVIALLAVRGLTIAHEGHEHKIMGKVVSVLRKV